MAETPTMHIDGAARGNPGPAAFAVVLARPGQPVVEKSETMGTATNNVAEYTALVEGLELAAGLGVKRVAVFSDSELLVKQMNGEYRVKHPDLQPLYQEANRLKRQFDAVTITHVRRGQNARADALCNEALDGKTASRERERPEARPAAPKKAVSDAAVRDDVLDVLRSASQAWASSGPRAVPVEAVWEQLWSILEEGGVLKKAK
jgi:ribonuclease HI